MKALCRKNTKFHFFTQIKLLSNALSHEHVLKYAHFCAVSLCSCERALLNTFICVKKWNFVFLRHNTFIHLCLQLLDTSLSAIGVSPLKLHRIAQHQQVVTAKRKLESLHKNERRSSKCL